MASDLVDLPEFDWEDPSNKKWAEAEENRFNKKYGPISHEQMHELVELRKQVQKEFPDINIGEAAQIAHERFLASEKNVEPAD